MKKEAGELEDVEVGPGHKQVKVEVGVEGGHILQQVDMDTVGGGMGEHVVEVGLFPPFYTVCYKSNKYQ